MGKMNKVMSGENDMGKWVCAYCGDIIEYCNTTWGKHIVCDCCNDILSENYSEDEMPSDDIFVPGVLGKGKGE